MPFSESSIAAACVGLDAQPARGLQVDVGRGLASGGLLRGDRGLEEVLHAQQLEREVDQLAVRRGRQSQGPAGGEPVDRFACARNDRKVLAIELRHPLDDLPADLLGRLGKADHVMHVARPLQGAHAHHVPLGVLVPAAAALLGELLAGLVPHLLGVEQDAVEVEDDRLDHSAT